MRLIDANKVVSAILQERDAIPKTVPAAYYELINEKPYHAGNLMRGGIRKALRCIEKAEAVDAVPVVRCRDCKYRRKNDENEPYCIAEDGLSDPWDDKFCSYGERKE